MKKSRRGRWEAVEERPSRSQLKRDSKALQELGLELARLPQGELELLGLAPELLEAISELRGMRRGEARRRQTQYLGRLMREVEDAELLRDACALFAEGRLPSSVPGFLDREPSV